MPHYLELLAKHAPDAKELVMNSNPEGGYSHLWQHMQNLEELTTRNHYYNCRAKVYDGITSANSRLRKLTMALMGRTEQFVEILALCREMSHRLSYFKVKVHDLSYTFDYNVQVQIKEV